MSGVRATGGPASPVSSEAQLPRQPVRPAALDRLLAPLHRIIWRDPMRRARKLLRFAETEADGGRDLARAAELTGDPLLRRLYLRHALDERRHAELFRQRASALASGRQLAESGWEINWLAPGERGLDDLRVERHREHSLLAFLHLSEKAAAGRFAVYRDVLAADPHTRAVFTEVLRDEEFHMTYTATQLARIAPRRKRRHLLRARAARLWRGYLRVAVALAGLLGGLVLMVQYFVILPLFAWLARRSARRERPGWKPIVQRPVASSLRAQY